MKGVLRQWLRTYPKNLIGIMPAEECRMKIIYAGVLSMTLFAVNPLMAANENADSLKLVDLNEVEVLAVRAGSSVPVAYTNMTQKDLKQVNYGQDMPYVLGMTPSAVSTSDGGAGIGYTSLRIRGTDATRINITANGIPINDAESHSVYWVNMPDMASSTNDLQVQRGVGTSTNGAGSFGASINMKTTACRTEPYAGIDLSWGSFNTHKETVSAGTGMIADHFTFDIRLSDIGSDGYIDRASSALNSYYLQAGWFAGSSSVRFISFGGKEKTYHAWNYASHEEMQQYGRTYNSCGYMFTDSAGVQHFYDNQVDLYTQLHYQLHLATALTSRLHLNAALHYTDGSGYYEEYKAKSPDYIRRKHSDSGFGGGVFSLAAMLRSVKLTLGGALNHYTGRHYGRYLWQEANQFGLNPQQDFYRSKGKKLDGNVYLKTEIRPFSSLIHDGSDLSLYADMQYRGLNYRLVGTGSNWYDDGQQHFDIDESFHFFNPKGGVNWQINPAHRLYASVGIAHKEPTRNNYTDTYLIEMPRSERLTDYELGYAMQLTPKSDERLTAGINLYYMDYRDQLALTGALNNIGEAISENVPDSYRMGAELMAGIECHDFHWNVNATLSRNRVKIGDRWNRLSFSPEIIANSNIGHRFGGLDVSLHSQYVGKQYMSNLDDERHRLDAYFVSNLNVNYTFKHLLAKSMTVGATVYNLFDEEYENNGWADGPYTGYAAQAGINFLLHLSMEF